MKILITGGLGKSAEPLIDLLIKANHDITIIDVVKNDQYSLNKAIKVVNGDVSDANIINETMKDMDVVVHLAVNTIDVDNAKLSFQTNVFGTYNIFMQALRYEVKKVLLASSAPVHALNSLANLQKTNNILDYFCSPDNDFSYDLTKNIQELIALNFSRTYSMNVLVLRLGHIVDGRAQTDLNGEPLSRLTYCRGGWVCKYDVAKAFLKAIESNFTGYHLLNIIGSYQAADFFDLSTSKEILDFECSEKFLAYHT